VAYTVVEEEHLDTLDGIKVLILPRVLVVDEPVAQVLSDFCRRGGMLVTESECGAYGSNGLYRYPEDRFLAKLTGVRELGRRSLDGASIALTLDGQQLNLPAAQWLTPLARGGDRVLSSTNDGPIAVDLAVEQGRAVMCGAYLGDAYYAGASTRDPECAADCQDFETFVTRLVQQAGIWPTVEILASSPDGDGLVHVELGRSAERRVAFVFFDSRCETVRLRFPSGSFHGEARDLVSGEIVRMTVTSSGEECDLVRPEWGLMILVQGM
jgi:hypothetical protein